MNQMDESMKDRRNEPLRAKRSLGQNFLTSPDVSRRIAAGLDLSGGEYVLEIGPGRGALTRWLAESHPKRLLLVEKDDELARLMTSEYPGAEVRNMDALIFPWESLAPGAGWRVAGNLPYNIASPLIWEMVSRGAGIDRAVVMVQEEVADRLAAPPGGRAYGALSAWVQSFSEVKKLFSVSPGAFRPRPKVRSAVVRFNSLQKDEKPSDPAALARLLHICFQSRRKQLKRILKNYDMLRLESWSKAEGVALTERPEQLSPKAFQRLSHALFRP
jgi:16S rRNA (adenine1518-N6/adenine1519-N6)-dimethyltransferase